ncbi:hypothetical protein TH25_01775 [Thalassospira profundimaris]|uniref:Uncharacterized protein n=1 Tax=Thalassospira profundimaris TaxID=502049 RepID=A0A367XMP9_9PROT|nr:hypothetical protein [Thalassospira profundimaris]RCK54091.1 hypothetical protein TH25_01775 [Thalassospira profundimaris]
MATLAFNSASVSHKEPKAAKPKFAWLADFFEAVRIARIMENSPARDHSALVNEWRAQMLGEKN